MTLRDSDSPSLVPSVLQRRGLRHSDLRPDLSGHQDTSNYRLCAALDEMVRDELSYVLSIPPSAFDRNTDLAEYGLDSVDAATVVSMLEDDLDIQVLPQDFAKLSTVNDIIGYLRDELVADPSQRRHS